MGDFLIEAERLQTGWEYGHRGLCLFFGFQDAGHYYDAHFASKTDPQANQIFIVDEKPLHKDFDEDDRRRRRGPPRRCSRSE